MCVHLSVMHKYCAKFYWPMKVTQQVVQLLTSTEAEDMTGMKFTTREYNRDSISPVRQELKAMGLTEFEACNLINTVPTSLVGLQIIVEEMVERFDENQMNRILELLKTLAK